jgi:HEAT repeat protein
MPPFRRFANRQFSRAAALLGCALFSAGCQLISLSDSSRPAELTQHTPSELDSLLPRGRWERNRDWSMLSDPDATSRAFRWTFSIPVPPPQPADGANAGDVDRTLVDRYAWLWLSFLSEGSPLSDQQLADMRQLADSRHWSAAILLARHDPDGTRLRRESTHVNDALRRICEGRGKFHAPRSSPSSPALDVPIEAQAAAVEAWCLALSQLEGDPEENFAPAGRLLEEGNLAEEVRGELFRGIARGISPRNIPGLNEVMVSCESERVATPLHLAAVEACLIHAIQQRKENFAPDAWPDGLTGCRFSDDPLLRKLYARWAVLAKHPDAFAVVKAQRLDNDLSVREAAVASLGLLEGEAAQSELLNVMAKGTDPERVAGIVCLARRSIDLVTRYARDDSPRVRAAVATALGRHPSPTSARILAEMLADRTSEVQLAALNACSSDAWKDDGRVSLWLQALRVGSLSARLAALSRLRSEWGREPLFPVEGTAEEREAAVRRLALEHGASAEVFTTFAAQPNPVLPSTEHLDADEVRRLVREFLHPSPESAGDSGVDERLMALQPSVVPVIEQELQRASGPRAERVYRELLPRLHPAYAALAAMEQPDVAPRRRAAHELRDAAVQASLPPLLLKRLSQRMAFEQDRQVWQDVLAAILPDAHPEAAQLALVALNSPWPDIRQLGCDYFERHPQPEFTPWLLPRLQDQDRHIRLRAIRVLAQCGNPTALDGYSGDPQAAGLRSLLTQADAQLRWEAVVAMSRLGDPQGAQELIRRMYDSHPRQREQAVQAMGQTGQTRFIEPLLRSLWTETDRGVQLAMLKALEQLVPRDEHPGLAPGSSIGDKINVWARWWEQQPRNRFAAASPRGAPDGAGP